MSEGTGTESAEQEAPTAAPVTQAPDEVTLLRSRNSGLDAKVTELTKAQTAAEARAAAAEARLADYEAGKVGADEALRAQLEAERNRSAAAEKKATLATIKAAYPESFAELGETAFGMTEDQLASLEARLQGVADSGEAPTPRGNNPTRSGQKTPAQEESSDDIFARLKTMPLPWS